MNTATDSLTSSQSTAPASDSTDVSARGGLRGLIVKATGVLLVVPALLNAGYDVYAAALKLPRTDAEKVNTEMFKKYFNKAPLATLPVPVKSSLGTVDARFAIYEEGEIYVEFGKHSQWFQFPRSDQPKKAAFSLFSSAFAQASPRAEVHEQNPVASQKESISGGVLIRSRIYTDGTTEQRKIDLRSGATLSVDFGKIAKENVPPQSWSTQTMRIDPLDLRQLHLHQQVR